MIKRTKISNVLACLTLLFIFFLFGATSIWAQTPIENEVAKLLASDGAAYDNFGRSVALDGDTALIGADDDDNGALSGSAYVFTRDGSGTWTEQAKLLASDGADQDWFGTSVGVSGDTALIGARNDDDNGSGSGSAYVFSKYSYCTVRLSSFFLYFNGKSMVLNPLLYSTVKNYST